MCEAENMDLALATKHWMWLMNALEVGNVPVTNAPMFCETKSTIDIAYIHK
jgi:hypothetical protein